MNTQHNKKEIIVLRDSDIFPNTTQTPEVVDVIWKLRPTGKIVLFNEDGKVALIGNKVNDYFLLPGGGLEDDESITKGICRECREETGCEIDIQKNLGITEDFRIRDTKHCITFGFSANVVSYGAPELTENETEIGAYVKWVTLPKALEILNLQEGKVRNGEVKFYNTCFNTIRDHYFLKQALV